VDDYWLSPSTLVPDPYSDAHLKFVTDNGIQHFQIGIEPNKSPFVTISQCNISAALGVVMNPANHPILIHCNKGKVCNSDSPSWNFILIQHSIAPVVLLAAFAKSWAGNSDQSFLSITTTRIPKLALSMNDTSSFSTSGRCSGWHVPTSWSQWTSLWTSHQFRHDLQRPLRAWGVDRVRPSMSRYKKCNGNVTKFQFCAPRR